VTWAATGWHLILSAPATSYQNVTVTATASVNVTNTPYYIEIFDENGTRLKACGSGATCTVDFNPSEDGSHLVAFISGWGTTLPPPNVQASSNVVTTTRLVIPG